MSFKKFLIERYVNLLSKEDKEKYADEVWDILQSSYKDIGGFKSADNKEELIKDSSIWKLIRKNGKIVTVSIYKDKNGRKFIAGGTDGSSEGKKGFSEINKADIKMKRAWAEVSGAPEKIAIKNGGTYIPNTEAEKLTGKKIIRLHDNGIHYDRMISGHIHTKALIGFPKPIDN
jgi:hypothetical protein